ncbi:MAG: hypothetical protein ACFB2Z_06510 [Maricaulaceae bacterium]
MTVKLMAIIGSLLAGLIVAPSIAADDQTVTAAPAFALEDTARFESLQALGQFLGELEGGARMQKIFFGEEPSACVGDPQCVRECLNQTGPELTAEQLEQIEVGCEDICFITDPVCPGIIPGLPIPGGAGPCGDIFATRIPCDYY